ncbi:phosphotransferase enzyme family protein [Penicillium brasilianum]|uniref:Phosphotransferase enzyme family protein n=1 Tax=Penicillium brasilianum TaxID=104259 RepID=A0A1S9RWG1_PENBI|nr:phosphotransferase enzyme family protein [Penicillium brasilianum]
MATLKSRHYEFVTSLVVEHFGIQKNDFKIEDMEKAKNNHVYLIRLDRPLTESSPAKSEFSKPYTSEIPAGTSKLVLRISKNNVNLEDSVRIQNEVAFLALARDALSAIDALVTPRVFGWEDELSTSPTPYSWIMEEFIQGDSLSPDEILALDHNTRQSLLYQIARVVKAFQDYRLPKTVSMYGGLKFDDQGEIVNTASTLPCGGPFHSYQQFIREMCTWQLKMSDRSAYLNRWRDIPGLRERLESFLTRGLDKLLDEIPEQKPTLIHADLCLPNLLFDRTSNRLTAVLDFDFAHIGAPISEYLFSFWDLGGLLPGSSDPDPLRNYILKGFPFLEEGVEDKWKLARAWDNALSHVGAKKPLTIEKAGDIADIWWFSQDLCEAYWFIDGFLEKRTPEKLEELKAESASNLEGYLTQWGF